MPESFRIDKKLRKIYLDSKSLPNSVEQTLLDYYSKSGYEIVIKSEKKSKLMKQRHKDNPMPKSDYIISQIKLHPELLEEYEKNYSKEKYFGLLKWYNQLIDQGKLPKEEVPKETKKKSRPKKPQKEETLSVEEKASDDA